MAQKIPTPPPAGSARPAPPPAPPRALALDKSFVDAVSSPIYRTWGQIAGDAAQLEGRMTQAGAFELVLDANRMTTYGGRDGVGEAADKLVGEAIDKFGYAKVVRFLRKHIKLDL